MNGCIKKIYISSFFLYLCFNETSYILAVPLSADVIQKRKIRLTAALRLFNRRVKNPKYPIQQANRTQKMTQTEAYMHRFKNEINALWSQELKKYDHLIKKIITREKEYVTTHYVFYHAHTARIRLIQDIIKELYRFFFQQAALPHFKFLRFWNDASPFKTPHDFLTRFKHEAFGHAFDRSAEVAKQLLSVNISLFGNRTLSGDGFFAGECTFTYFLNNRSHLSEWYYPYLRDLFSRLGLQNNRVEKLIDLSIKLEAPDNTGQLIQIFIPKDKVDQYIYVSHYSGTPHSEIQTAAANVTFNKTLNRHTSIKPILESYQNKPFEMDTYTYDQLQARLLFNPDVFNPKSNIKIYRYCSIPKRQLADYKKQLRTILTDALEEWCTQYAKTSALPPDLTGTAIYSLLQKN